MPWTQPPPAAGMLLGLSLSSAIGDSSSKVALAFVATLTTVGLSSYLSLRPLCLATLNWARCRILMDRRAARWRARRPSRLCLLTHSRASDGPFPSLRPSGQRLIPRAIPARAAGSFEMTGWQRRRR